MHKKDGSNPSREILFRRILSPPSQIKIEITIVENAFILPCIYVLYRKNESISGNGEDIGIIDAKSRLSQKIVYLGYFLTKPPLLSRISAR